MKKFLFIFVIILIILPEIIFSQNANTKSKSTISGTITDKNTKEPLFGVNITAVSLVNKSSGTFGSATDFSGNYTFSVPNDKYQITVQYVGYEIIIDTVDVKSFIDLDYIITESSEVLSEVVVSAGKFEQKISEITVSMEVLKPTQLENKNTYDLTSALTKLSGVDVNDGQISIHSSSGWSYGAGSRVLILMDELPIMSADVGDVKWDFIPMENISQIEVIKGASSALFGSSALGGVVNIRSAYPGPKPETNVSYYVGTYGNPREDSWKWWGNDFYNDDAGRNPVEIIGRKSIYYFFRAPMYSGLSFNHKQQFGNLDLVIGGNNTCDEGYRINDYKQNTRFNVNTRYRFKKVEGLSVGFNSNFMATIKSDFFNYASDTTPFLPNPNVSMVFPTHGFRFNFDPFVYYYSPRDGGRYSLRTRYFRTNNINSDESKSSTSDTYYAEFQYNNTFAKRWIVTAGIVESYSKVYANLFGNHTANNTSLYAQLDAKFNRLKISLGLRGEYFMLDSEHSETAVKNFPIRPVARVGLNYELTEKTFIRASIGQGYRFPSISEKYTSTDLGGAAIHPNPNALPETGWNTEIGLKQGFNISSNWKGFADFSIYHQQMHNMLEFSFGIFDHNTGKEVPLILDSLDAIDTLEIGFIAKNMNDVMISGFDISTGIVGKINRATLSATLSYSYNYPLHKDGADETASTTTNLLKYRFKHSIKADFQIDAKRLIAGLSVEWKSAIKNVDRIFCDERDLADLSTEQDIAYYFYGELLSNQVLIPGYWNYRKENAKKTFLNIDVNFGFNFSHNVKAVFVVRNLLNQTFSGRPADICAPRRYEVMVTYKFN